MAKKDELIRFSGCLLVAVVLSGCSDLLPGLNLNERETSGDSYKIVPSSESTGFSVSSEEERFAYDVIPVTPKVVAGLNTRQSTPASGPDETLKELTPAAIAPEYLVGAGDTLFVTVWEHPDLTAAVAGQLHDFINEGRLVRANGTIFFPYAGTVSVAGKTVDDIAAELTQRISKDIANPQVDVRVTSFKSKRIEVTGEVMKPGIVTLDNASKGIREAIGETGGLTLAASRRRVLLERNGKVYLIELSGHLSGKHAFSNIELQAGDTVDVPDQSGDQVFVLGAVDKQQPVVIQQDSLSLIQALATAGGLDKLTAKDSGVLIFRLPEKTAGGRATVYALDMSSPKGVLLAGQFPLEPRDVVFVKATAFAQYNAVITDLLPSLQTLVNSLSIIYLTR